MKRSNRQNASKREYGVDRISNLPDPILESILSGLPTTKEVIRTSKLSTRWRYLWTSNPSIDLDVSRGSKNPKKLEKIKFQDFVSTVLANETIGLESFRLCCLSYYNMSTVLQWIEAAISRKVKRLDLIFSTKDHVIKLPHCLVTCDSLESLRLALDGRPISFPESISFCALKVLELNNVYCFDTICLEKFLKICPLLEKLSLVECFIVWTIDQFLHISCPKLKTLIIHDRKNVFFEALISRLGLKVSCPELVLFECLGLRVGNSFIFENVDSLKTAVIHPEGILYRNAAEFRVMIRELLAQISNVEFLSLNLYFIQSIQYARDPQEHFPALFFPNLKTLEVTTTIKVFTMDLVMHIIRFSPNLESLHLIIQEELLGTEYSVLDRFKTSRIMTTCLKKVKFLAFNGEKQKLDMARLLVEYGIALEEMVFTWFDEVKYHDKSVEIMNEVSKFHKASSTVKLINLLED